MPPLKRLGDSLSSPSSAPKSHQPRSADCMSFCSQMTGNRRVVPLRWVASLLRWSTTCFLPGFRLRDDVLRNVLINPVSNGSHTYISHTHTSHRHSQHKTSHSSTCKYFLNLGSFAVPFVLPLTEKRAKIGLWLNMRSVCCDSLGINVHALKFS